MSVPVPYNRYFVVTTSDTVALPNGPCDALYVGGTGNLVAVMQDGTTCLFSTIPAGTVLDIAVIRVNATSTTASTIVALYVV